MRTNINNLFTNLTLSQLLRGLVNRIVSKQLWLDNLCVVCEILFTTASI